MSGGEGWLSKRINKWKASVADSGVGGSVHCVFEGYFVYNHARMPGRMDVLAQLWKEYALSDSRYVSSDPLLLCMEILSVVCLFRLVTCEGHVDLRFLAVFSCADCHLVNPVHFRALVYSHSLADCLWFWVPLFLAGACLYGSYIQ